MAHGSARNDFESDTFLVAGTLTGGGRKRSGYSTDDMPIVPAVVFDETQVTNPDNRSNPQPGDPCHTLSAQGRPPAMAFKPSQTVAFTAKDHGADATVDLSPTLRAGGHVHSHSNGGVMPAVTVPVPVGFNWQNGGGFGNANDGMGITQDGTGPLTRSQTPAVAYAFQQRIGRNGRGDDGDVVSALTAQAGSTGKGDSAPCVAYAFKPGQSEAAGGFMATEDYAPTLQAASNGSTQVPAVAFQERGRVGGRNLEVSPEVAYALTTGGGPEGGRSAERNVLTPMMAVRRFMPVECERLQGFPDNYTLVPYRGALAKDSPRYKGIGNSWAITCVTWIGQRIEQVEATIRFHDALGGVSLEM